MAVVWIVFFSGRMDSTDKVAYFTYYFTKGVDFARGLAAVNANPPTVILPLLHPSPTSK